LLGDDPDRIRALAAMVDERMSEAARRTPTVDTMRVAILAALSLAHDLEEARGSGPGLDARSLKRIHELQRKVRETLDQLSPMERLPLGIE
jgi:cell division protein ZapA